MDMYTTSFFAPVCNWPPVFQATFNAHSCESDFAVADLGVASNVFVHDTKQNVVSNASYLKLDAFVPTRISASIFKGLSSCRILAVADDDVWSMTKS